MTSTTLRTPTQISDRPTGTSSAPAPGGPRRPRRRVAIVGVVVAGTLVAVAAVGTGVELGQRATSPAVPAVGRAVIYPPDWQAYRAGEYARSLSFLAGLKPSVDAFFDSVMVNVDSPALRANRLALLATLRATMNRVADLSLLAV